MEVTKPLMSLTVVYRFHWPLAESITSIVVETGQFAWEWPDSWEAMGSVEPRMWSTDNLPSVLVIVKTSAWHSYAKVTVKVS